MLTNKLKDITLQWFCSPINIYKSKLPGETVDSCRPRSVSGFTLVSAWRTTTLSDVSDVAVHAVLRAKQRLRFHVLGLSRFRRLQTTRLVTGHLGGTGKVYS